MKAFQIPRLFFRRGLNLTQLRQQRCFLTTLRSFNQLKFNRLPLISFKTSNLPNLWLKSLKSGSGTVRYFNTEGLPGWLKDDPQLASQFQKAETLFQQQKFAEAAKFYSDVVQMMKEKPDRNEEQRKLFNFVISRFMECYGRIGIYFLYNQVFFIFRSKWLIFLNNQKKKLRYDSSIERFLY